MDSSSIPTISYNDFGALLNEKTGVNRIPYSATIEITPHCNLKCIHCYISPCQWEGHILSYAEICRIIDAISEAGCLWLCITGGEPLIRPEFLDIYTYIKKKGIFVTLFTNGTLITPAMADFLYEWKPRAVEITLYGATKQTYEKVTGVSGSFELCNRGIELLTERRIPLRLKSVALTINKDELGAMKEYAQKLGVEFRWDPSMMPRLDHGLEPCGYRLTPEEVIEIELADPERVQAWHKDCLQGQLGTIKGDSLYVCGAGKHSFFIDSYGRLSQCVIVRSQSYDLRRGSFSEAWNDFLPKVLRQKAKDSSRCRGCELLALCGRCPAIAELETGDPDAEVPWLCRLAHLRLESGIFESAQLK